MKHPSFFRWLYTSLIILQTPSLVWAYGNLNESYQKTTYEEVTYEELVQELNSKKSSVARKKNASLKTLSVGVGYVHSYTQLNIHHQVTERSQNGLQVAASMNLDSPNLYTEGVFRSFSGSTLSQEDLQILQLDGRLGFSTTLSGPWKYHLFTGFSGRLIQASNKFQDYNMNEFTPSFTAGTGATAEIHKNIRLGFEVGGRTSILGKNMDKSSADFTVRLDTFL